MNHRFTVVTNWDLKEFKDLKFEIAKFVLIGLVISFTILNKTCEEGNNNNLIII